MLFTQKKRLILYVFEEQYFTIKHSEHVRLYRLLYDIYLPRVM